jgi:Uma2 family endonuclease
MTTTIPSISPATVNVLDAPGAALRSLDDTWDRARWEQLPADGNRYEVIGGVLYMSTAPSVFHQWIIHQLVRRLLAQIEDSGVGFTLWSPIGVFMPGCDPVQPDVLVIRAEDAGVFQNRRIEGVPALIVEVLSPSNPQYDLRTKRQAYARAGLPEYWVVRPATRDVLVCWMPDPTLGDYVQSRLFETQEELLSPTLPVRLPVADLFAGAPDTTV